MYFAVQKLMFSFKDFFNKWEQISSFTKIWSHLLTKSVNKKFNFCAVLKRKIAKQNWNCNISYCSEVPFRKSSYHLETCQLSRIGLFSESALFAT